MPELNQIMYVIKRNGIKEEVQFDKVQGRIRNLSSNLNINSALVAQRVCSRIYDGVRTHELDELASQICTSMSTENTDYGKLAHRIVISNNHKLTNPDFFETISQLYHYNASMISKELFEFIELNKEVIQETINYKLDYNFDFFGFKTLEKAYLLKINGKTAERIQHMIMRVSCGLHIGDIESALNSYKFMSQKYFTHATPTLFHSGTKKSQLLSCFLIGTHDSINGIFKTISDCAKISQLAGGIGVHIDNIRSQGSYIRGTNGKSQGIIPMLRVYNDTAKYVNQGGKRNGSIAIYLEPHHPDILDFLDLRKNHGNEDQRCRDLFTALMISDLFMRKLEEALTGGEEFEWAFFDPDTTPGLGNCYGEEYERLYFKYLEEGKYVSRVPILKLWRKIISSQVETGTPYILYKDQMNRTSNQKNIGIIKSSNLCAEIAEYSDDKEYACCCLASISFHKPAY
jgi:ribonucleoside-diphosphate reductase alpha chain